MVGYFRGGQAIKYLTFLLLTLSCHQTEEIADQYDQSLNKGPCSSTKNGSCNDADLDGDGKLSWFERSMAKRLRANVQCSPQPELDNLWLKSANNFYAYRNDKIFLELNSTTGIFRRLIIGEGKSNEQRFYREIGCFFIREDKEVEPVKPKDYGKQILLDLELAASSKVLHPMEVYRYDSVTPGNWEFVRFDDQSGVNWKFCPTRTTPWDYCTELRNGNIMFYVDNLDAITKSQLEAEAHLIRSEYNFIEISESEFKESWNDHLENSNEGLGDGWKYVVSSIPDVPSYIHRAWRDYLRGQRVAMPDTSSNTMPPVCYQSNRQVILDSGETTYLEGEACYLDGVYTFTEN